MRSKADTLLRALCVASWLLAGSRLEAADVSVKLIVHPTRAGTPVTKGEARAIYLKQKMFWTDGEPIIANNREAGSEARELFSKRVFGRDSRRLAGYWNQRYFEAGEFPPATLASEAAVVRFVSENPNAVGYVTASQVSDAVTVALVLE
jgi:ABC-type phosphate transport system substrate-binding protein